LEECANNIEEVCGQNPTLDSLVGNLPRGAEATSFAEGQ
jgi:hypothetical protein